MTTATLRGQVINMEDNISALADSIPAYETIGREFYHKLMFVVPNRTMVTEKFLRYVQKFNRVLKAGLMPRSVYEANVRFLLGKLNAI